MAKLQNVLSNILDKYKPKEAEKMLVRSKVQRVLLHLREAISDNHIDAVVMLGGSAAKGTFVTGDFDCDVFVRFDMKYKDKNISDILEKLLRVFDKIERVHGSRDYFQSYIDDINFEFVPVLEIADPEFALNVTDSSPLHVGWIKSRIESNDKIIDSIILAKLFCKAHKIYGAESYIRGFSGHVLDIMISHYGSFINLLESSQSWKDGEVIDIENHGTASSLNESKISPLIVIDPIQPDRNAAAALNLENMMEFKRIAKEFMENPSKDFFEKKEITTEELISKAGDNSLFIFDIIPHEGKTDVVGGKLLKVYERLKGELLRNDFEVLDSDWDWDKKFNSSIWIISPDVELSETKKRVGPPVTARDNADSFRKKHPKCYEEDGKLVADVSRDYRRAEDLLAYQTKDNYVKEKVDSITLSKVLPK